MKKRIKTSLLASLLLATTINANEDLGTITVISATKTEQSIQDVTSNVNVITNIELEEKHYTTVAQALNSIAGISFTQQGGLGATTNINIRGMHSKRVLVLIDGIRYNDPTDSLYGAAFNHLMIEDIEQIEVIKGAQSGVWGADAAAGVINIITKSAKKGIHGSAYSEVGSFNTKKYGATISNKTDKYSFKLSTNVVDTDGFTSYATNGVDIDNFEDDGYRNTTTSAKFDYKINESNKINIQHTIIDTNSEYDKYNADTSYTKESKSKFTSLNFNHINNINELDIYAKKSTFNRKYTETSVTNYIGDIKEYGLKSNISYNNDDFILFGIENTTFNTDEYGTSTLNKNYKSDAIFISNTNIFNGLTGGKTIVTESIRKDNYSAFNNKTTGKIGVKHFHENIKDFTTSLNYGTAYKVPNVSHLYGKPTYNQNVNPESITSYDISLNYKNFKITKFNTEVDDMISYVNATDGYENRTGISTTKGYEAEYITTINDDISILASYTTLSSKDKDGKDLKRIAQETAKLNIDYYGIDKLHIGLNGEYVGERYNSDDKQGAQTGKYTLFNVVTNYDIKQNISLYAKIDNITNKYYQTVDGYATSPRAFYAGIKVEF
ncbi:MAG: TonB-dependent receptor [Arcobacteraceae bacterium]|nr:TonB-dependent receptor [Arcobacteraceae bacterium]